MDEYERIEEELSQVYATYVVKLRCLAYLEEQLEELEKAQKIEFAVSASRVPPEDAKHTFSASSLYSTLSANSNFLNIIAA